MAAVSATPDQDLDARSFEVLFASGCTATYSELLYYLPLALDYLCHQADESLELIGYLVAFLAREADALLADGYLAPALAALRGSFENWTASFTVTHYDGPACRAKGWDIDHYDVVVNGQAVKALVDHLWRNQIHAALADELVLSWRRTDRTATAAAWLLEYARAEREYYSSYELMAVPQGLNLTPSRKRPAIHELLIDSDVLGAALAAVTPELVAYTGSPTYWPDLVRTLDLAPD